MKRKIIVMLPAFNAEKTLTVFLKKLNKHFTGEIILVDDYSSDNTFKLASKNKNLKVFRNIRNLGYGGNIKSCLFYVLERGADIIIEIHPDGEYDPEVIPEAIRKVEEGNLFVLGNRFGKKKSSGIFYWKYLVIKFLNKIDKRIIGTEISDLHQGFRVYTKDMFEKLNLQNTANDYSFSFEIIIKSVLLKIPIGEVDVKSSYSGRKRGVSLVNGLIYGLKTFRILLLFKLHKLDYKTKIFSMHKSKKICKLCNIPFFTIEKFSFGIFKVFYCSYCLIGFTDPVPKNMNKYYSGSYWEYGGFLGFSKNFLFNIFQRRREKWIKKFLVRGEILDVGSGEADFAKRMNGRLNVMSLEPEFSKVNNSSVIKKDFLKFSTKIKFDAIVFWESFEHIDKPKEYLNKARSLLKPNGLIFIEYPRFNSLEANIFGKSWFHLDIPRHIFHFSDNGMKSLLERNKFRMIKKERVLAPEYSIWGFVASLISFSLSKGGKRPMNLLIIGITFPLLFFAIITEILLFTLGGSPIGLIVAKRDEDR